MNKLRKFIFFLIILYLIINETWAETNNYIKALEFLRKEDYFHALPLFEAALKKSPENIFIKADYVLCLIWMGNYKKAIEFYLQNEDSLKDVKYLTRNIAKAFYEVKNYHEAKKLYEKALLNNPKDIEAIKGLIFTLCKLGDYEKAYRIIEEKRNFLNKKILYFLKAYTLQQKEFYNDAYILYSKLTLLEGEEKFLKEIQDARRDIIKNFKKEEITYLFKKFQQKPLK
ncbi:MAG TPA: tetratricopeptide repeat protein [Candidatus Desulfofervidus auxilii]|uniref:Tetratricopeptide repeat protein n=1 Tax=Desulfofervidus auxilii TaxID=1621989 RepID=A0A7C0U1I1_DESA2|nr:tetratricopeptide repeat protein [Candidatus Desulfofervidus auxilii]